MKSYKLLADARLDLLSIWEYIADDNVEVADRWSETLLEACEALVQMPRLGHARKDLTSHQVLFWPVGSYLVIYRITLSPIEILGIVHGARDIPQLLKQRNLR